MTGFFIIATLYFKVPAMIPRISAQKGLNLGLKVKPKIRTLFLKVPAMILRINAQKGLKLGVKPKIRMKTLAVLCPIKDLHAKWNLIR